MFGIRKKQPSKAPDGFAIGLDPAKQGSERTGMLVAQRTGTMIVYWADDGWRWRLVAPNGKIVADSGEAYKRRYDCKVAAQHLTHMARHARLEVRDR